MGRCEEAAIRYVTALALLAAACTTTAEVTTPPAPPPTTAPTTSTTTTTLPPVDFSISVDLTTLPGRIAVVADTAYVIDAGGADRIDIPEAAGLSQPTWDPDGQTLAFASFEAAQPAIGIVRPGEAATTIEAPFLPFYFHWSPDGKTLAFLGNGPSGLVELGLSDIEAGTAIGVDAGTPYYFDWSPGSDRIFSHAGTAATRIVPIDGPVEPVDDNAGLYQAPQWTESGVLQQISVPATISARGLRLRLQETEQALVLGPPFGDGDRILDLEGLGAFESNGADIAFTDTETPTSVLRGPLMVFAGGDIIPITDGPVIAFEWSPDGSRLLFLEADGPRARWAVWERGETLAFDPYTPSVTSIRSYFPFWDQYARSLTLWAPDGRAFVYAAFDAGLGRSQVLVQPVEAGAAPSVIGDGEWASWSS